MKNKSALLLAIGLGLAFAAVWLLTVSGFGVQEARAASLTVCATGCDYSVIQDAVDAASDGDVIKVAAGTGSGMWSAGFIFADRPHLDDYQEYVFRDWESVL